MNKRILINGYPRSGTTYLYIQLAKENRRILYEPLSPHFGKLYWTARKLTKIKFIEHPYYKGYHYELIHKPPLENFSEEVFQKLMRYHPCKDGKHHFLFNTIELFLYLKSLRNFHIKETHLHFYLNSKVIRRYWSVYHIIRHPIDVWCSIILRFILHHNRSKFLLKIYRILKSELLRYIYLQKCVKELLNPFNIIEIAYEIQTLLGRNYRFYLSSLEDAFIISWIISNYQAVSSIPKDHVIVYEKPETYKRLPFELKDPLRIKIYPKAREDLSYKFEKIAKKWDLDSEYNYLLKLFD